MKVDDHILIGYLDNTISEEEKANVEVWRASSPENEKILEQMYFTLQLTERMHVMNTVDTEKAFAHFKSNTKRQNRRVRLSLWLGLQRIAAVLFIPALILAGYLLFSNQNYDRHQMVEINTNPGVISTFDLPDGSKVWLNGGSSLKYANNFNTGKRTVELNGEGFFEVTKNPDKPFTVQVNPNYSIEVLGTSFNILAYATDDIIETTLVTGLVKLNWLSEKGMVSQELKPNEKAEYQKNNKNLSVNDTNVDANTGWKDGKIIFKQEPMDKVLQILSRHYNVTFNVKDQEIMKSVITATFKDEQLVQVMEYLKMASNINYTIEKPIVNDNNNMLPKTIVEIRK